MTHRTSTSTDRAVRIDLVRSSHASDGSRRGSVRSKHGGTPPVPPPEPRRIPSPLRPATSAGQDVGLLVAAALSSFCLVWVIFYQLTLLSGGFGFLVCWYVGFLALTWIGTAQMIERQVATDRVVAGSWSAPPLLVVASGRLHRGLGGYKAIPTIHWGALFTKDQKHFQRGRPQCARPVGVLHAIIGTLEQVLIAAAIGVPFAIATAVFLNEVGAAASGSCAPS